jgi:hypothetical protein
LCQWIQHFHDVEEVFDILVALHRHQFAIEHVANKAFEIRQVEQFYIGNFLLHQEAGFRPGLVMGVDILVTDRGELVVMHLAQRFFRRISGRGFICDLLHRGGAVLVEHIVISEVSIQRALPREAM